MFLHELCDNIPWTEEYDWLVVLNWGEREAERRGEGEGRRVEEKERNERLVLRLRRTNNNTRFDTLEIIGKK